MSQSPFSLYDLLKGNGCNVQTEAWAKPPTMEWTRAPAVWPALLTKASKKDTVVFEELIQKKGSFLLT